MESAQNKIDDATKTADQYERLADHLKIGGISLCVLGGVMFLFGLSQKKKK
jgi:hypothetical protein